MTWDKMGIFFNPPPKWAKNTFFRLFWKTAQLCLSNVLYCILRWIWGSWTHFWQNFYILHTFRLSTAPWRHRGAQKWHILAIFATSVSKGHRSKKCFYVEFLKVFPEFPKSFLMYLEVSSGSIEGIWPTKLQHVLGQKLKEISKF